MGGRMIRAMMIGLLLLSSFSMCSGGEIDQTIEGLLRASLDIQYGIENKIEMREVFTDRFIKEIDKYFYKADKVPFKVMNIIELEKHVLYDVRIRDKAGEYIQEVKLVRIGEKYWIDRILYDI